MTSGWGYPTFYGSSLGPRRQYTVKQSRSNRTAIPGDTTPAGVLALDASDWKRKPNKERGKKSPFRPLYWQYVPESIMITRLTFKEDQQWHLLFL